jgi:hypothetical protein
VHLRPSSAGALLAKLAGSGSPPPDPFDGPWSGSWSATRWQYAGRDRPERVVDVVCDLGGTVTLSLTAGTYILSWSVPGNGDHGVGGVLRVEGDRLILVQPGGALAQEVVFHLADRTLSLSGVSDWDFGDGEEPADFVAVLVRL